MIYSNCFFNEIIVVVFNLYILISHTAITCGSGSIISVESEVSVIILYVLNDSTYEIDWF